MAPHTAAQRNIIIFFWKVRSCKISKILLCQKQTFSSRFSQQDKKFIFIFHSRGVGDILPVTILSRQKQGNAFWLSPFLFSSCGLVCLSSINALSIEVNSSTHKRLADLNFWDCIVAAWDCNHLLCSTPHWGKNKFFVHKFNLDQTLRKCER